MTKIHKKNSTKETALQKIKNMGLVSDMDLALHLPFRYEDNTQLQTVAHVFPKQRVQLEGVIDHVFVDQRRQELKATFTDQTGQLRLRWIHYYPSQKAQIEKKGLVRVQGEIRGGDLWGLEIVHPKVTQAGKSLPVTLTPVYHSTSGVTQEILRREIHLALSRLSLEDSLPDHIREHYGLAPFKKSLHTLHHPTLEDDLQALSNKTHEAWQRIKFDELLAQQLALQVAREARLVLKAPVIDVLADHLYQTVLKRFAWQLTQAQEKVLKEIKHDLQGVFPMHRLIQGDVGSGKTIVAALAAAIVIQNHYQVAVMAPTEILAEQHFIKMREWFKGLVDVVWLSGSLSTRDKKEALEKIRSGQAALVVGTQALIQESVQFSNLALLIVDEQHRFGVGQRLSLSQKGSEALGGIVPHQLNMSATPIPRTLAMSYFADMDVSVIDELPAGRQAIRTYLKKSERRDEVLLWLSQACEQGKQAYWVCPLVEESEALQLETAIDTHQYIQAAFPHLAVGLLHGRMKSEEKAQVMHDFETREIAILVSTTVIEVGVDVPNASIMVIEHAERFGLAQLHQLRGRVGRGKEASSCVLMYQEPLSETAKLRLKALYETNDGFEIARRDLEQRGPGEFLGLKQSGEQMLRFANVEEDEVLLEQARELAVLLLKEYPIIAKNHMERWLQGKEQYLRT